MQGRRLAFAGAAVAGGAAARPGEPKSHTFWGPAHAVAQLRLRAREIVKCKAVERTKRRVRPGSAI